MPVDISSQYHQNHTAKVNRVVLSIIIPVYNESLSLNAFLQPLQSLRAQGCEIIVVDGGSSDDTMALAAPWVDQLQCCEPGRARQMNCGAALAGGDSPGLSYGLRTSNTGRRSIAVLPSS